MLTFNDHALICSFCGSSKLYYTNIRKSYESEYFGQRSNSTTYVEYICDCGVSGSVTIPSYVIKKYMLEDSVDGLI